MRNTRKIIVALILVMTILMTMAMAVIPASAENIPGGTKLYLVPNANWNQSNARFAAYFFGDGEAWVSMTKVAGESNLYEVTAPAGKNFTNVIFCRMNPSASANNWDNKWNQTADLTFNGTSNCYTVKEGTWDSGGGTWSTYGNSCAHANVGAAATCTTAQVCNDCGDPVVSALGHTYNTAHLCTRCNGQATFTVAGSGAHLGTEWDTGNTANDMTYADGVYTKVYTNVAAGSYLLKVARDHDWGTAYPSADKSYTVATTGSTVTVTLKGTTVTITVEAPHTHSWSDATCTEAQKCECGETQGEALGHNYVDGACSVCGEAQPCEHVFEQNTFYHPELVAATCCTPGVAVFECTLCDYYYTEATEIDPEAHGFWGESEVITPADCKNQTNGLKKVACANGCGQFKEEEISYEYAHTMDVQKDVQATCTEAGGYYAVCTNCGFVEEYTSEAQGHYNWYATCGDTTTCMAEGCGVEFTVVHTVDPCEGGMCMNCWTTIEGAHNYVDGKCSVCEAVDPDYVAPEEPKKVTYVFNANDLADFDGDKAKGEEMAVGTDGFFTLIFSTNSKTQTDDKTFDDGESFTKRLSFNGNTKIDGGYFTRTIKFTTNGPATITIWWNSGGNDRQIELFTWDGEGDPVLVTATTESVKSTLYITTFEIEAAGTYYLGHTGGTNYFYKVALTQDAPAEDTHEHTFVEGKCECGEEDPNYVPAHKNSLVVGDTNKIVVSGETLNDNGLPIEWVPFVADEKAHYEFIGDNGALAFIFAADGSFISATGAADLEAGTYLICVGNGLVGEFNVAVTKSEIVIPEEPEHKNALVVGDNKFIVTDEILAGFIEYITFVAAEDGKYTFTASEGSNFVFFAYTDAWTENWEYTDPYVTNNGTGDNFVSVNLKAGLYLVGVNYFYGGTVAGEYNVNVTVGEYEDGGNVVVKKNEVVLGDNTYALTESLLGIEFEFTTFTADKSGYYTFAGQAPLTFFIWPDYPNTAVGDIPTDAPYVWNVKADNSGFEESFTVYLEAGVYAVGFRYDFAEVGDYTYTISYAEELPHEHSYEAVVTAPTCTDAGFTTYTCACGDSYVGDAVVGLGHDYVDGACSRCEAKDPNYVPPHEHNFVEGKCECGETDPDYVAPEQPGEEVELTLVQKIMKAINDLMDKIGTWFKNLIAGFTKK